MKATLKAVYVEWPPWAMNTRLGNETVLDGVMKDVYDALSQSLKFKFNVQRNIDETFGFNLPDGSYSGMLGMLYRKEADIGGPFVASEQRSEAVDFSNCLAFRKLGIVTGIISTESDISLYANAFSLTVWILLLISLVGVVFVSFLIYIVNFGGDWEPKCHVFSQLTWMSFGYLTGHGCEMLTDRVGKNVWFKNSFRILIAAWLLGPVINFIYILQGTVVSSAAISKQKPLISSLDDLARKKHIIVVTTKGSATQACFLTNEEQAHFWGRMQNNSITLTKKSMDETLVKVEKGTHVMIVDYNYALSIASYWVERTGRCKVQVEELLFCQTFISLGMRKGLNIHLKKKINTKLTDIMQAKIVDRWMNRLFNNYTHCTKHYLDRKVALGISDIKGCFALWGLGISISFLVLLMEITMYNVQRKGKYIVMSVSSP